MAKIHKMRWMAIAALMVAVIGMVQPVIAYSNNFQDQATGWSGSTTRVTYGGYSDAYGLQVGAAAAYDDEAAYSTASVTFVSVPDDNKGQIIVYGPKSAPGMYDWSKTFTGLGKGRYTIIWSSPHTVLLLKNGSEVAIHISESVVGAPTYFGVGTTTSTCVIDDYVKGSGSVIGGPPSTWFLATDINNPDLYGLYDDSYTLIDQHELHYTYGDSSSMSDVRTYDFGIPTGPVTVTYSGASFTVPFKGSVYSACTVDWSKDEFALGENASVSWNVSSYYWDVGEFNYKLRVFRADDLVNYVDEKIVSTISGNTTFSTSGYTNGYNYVVELIAFFKTAPNTPYMLDYDVAAILSGVTIEGYVYDAINNTAISNASVWANQGATSQSNLTLSGGQYTIPNQFEVGSIIYMGASKTGFLTQNTSFTPIDAGFYNVTFGLAPGTAGDGSPLPDWPDGDGPGGGSGTTNPTTNNTTTPYYNWTIDGTALGGLVTVDPWGAAGAGATVTLSNGTWNSSTTAGGAGWYQFNNIGAGGTYNAVASLSGYDTVATPVTLLANNFTRLDFNLGLSAGLTINVFDAETRTPISGAYVTLSDGQSATTSGTGAAVFNNVEFGAYTFSAAKAEYYSGGSSVVVDSPIESATVYLTPIDSFSLTNESRPDGYGVGYPPHDVKFHLQSLWGAPIGDVDVVATGVETTTGSWDWLATVLGMNLTAAPIHNTTLSGSTDDYGDITFLMIPSVKYCMTFTKTGYTFDSPKYIQPKDEYYVEFQQGNTTFFSESSGYNFYDVIDCSVTTSTCNATHAWVNLSFADTLNQTTACNVTLCQSAPGSGTYNRTVLQYNNTCSGYSSCNVPFLVSGYSGQKYFVNVNGTHTSLGAVKWDFGVSFPQERASGGLPQPLQIWTALGIIIFTALLAGATSNIQVSFICCLEGWFFFAIGWLADLGANAAVFLTFATLISLFAIFMARKNKERFA